MVNNNLYNLMLQIVEEHKALWRIEDAYIKDAKSSPETKKLWQKISKEKKLQIQELTQLIKKQMQ